MVVILLLTTIINLYAVEKEDISIMQSKIDSVYEFKELINLDATPVKNQNRTGTCWTFAGNSFLESELIRMGKGNYDLSEMFIVRNMYPEKALNYVRYHGNTNFGQGALTHDVFRNIEKNGVVPEYVYSSRPENGYLNHIEMAGILEDIVKRVVKTAPKDRTSKWKDAYEAVLDAYMGAVPENFNVDGKQYTPKSFAEFLGIKSEDYIDITSFIHHPFYKQFVLEVPDNFSQGLFYNVKMSELIDLVDHAVRSGYTIDWGTDVTEPNFKADYGLAINPADMKSLVLDKKDIKWDSIYTELEVTEQIRQDDFDHYLTQDDHGMHIIGIAKDKLGRNYFIVKNSWGEKNRGRGGYLYVSYSYFTHKTTSITLHKDALKDELKKKLSIR